MHLFVDGGASNGKATDRFLMNHTPENWCIYQFEPTIRHAPILQEKAFMNPNIHFIPKALWVEDGYLVFNDYGEKFESNNLIDENTKEIDYLGQPKEIEYLVECIDFLRWIKENTKQFHYKILKLDVEGAEFFILNKMIEKKMIGIFNEYWIEFHARFDRSLFSPIKNIIVTELKKKRRKLEFLW